MAFANANCEIGSANIIDDRNRDAVIDASGEKVAFIVRAGKAGDISKVGFWTATVTTGDTLKVSLQDIDATTGAPDEVVDQSGTVVVADTDDDVYKEVTLGANRTVTRGELLAVVIEFNSYVAGNLKIRHGDIPTDPYSNYVNHKTLGSWTKVIRMPLVALEYSDGSYAHIPNCPPGRCAAYNSIDTASTPDEVGLKFTPAVPLRICGIRWAGWVQAAATFDVVLYNSSDTVLESVSVDPDILKGNSTRKQWYVLFANVEELTSGAVYRAVIKPTHASNVIGLHYVEVNSNAQLNQMQPGANYIVTERTDAGAWTDTNTRQPAITLLIDGLDDGAGGGGGPVILTRPRRVM